jgi:hypothetical protein
MFENPRGKWISVEDHKAAIEELQEALAPFALHGRALLKHGIIIDGEPDLDPLYSIGESHLTPAAFTSAMEQFPYAEMETGDDESTD